MAKNITGDQNRPSGGNDSYTIPGRGSVSRPTLVREVKTGKHPGHHVVKIGGVDFVRANPDDSDSNNVNKS